MVEVETGRIEASRNEEIFQITPRVVLLSFFFNVACDYLSCILCSHQGRQHHHKGQRQDRNLFCKYWLLKGNCCLERNTVNIIFLTERSPKKEISEKVNSDKELNNDEVVHLYFHFSFLVIG